MKTIDRRRIMPAPFAAVVSKGNKYKSTGVKTAPAPVQSTAAAAAEMPSKRDELSRNKMLPHDPRTGHVYPVAGSQQHFDEPIAEHQPHTTTSKHQQQKQQKKHSSLPPSTIATKLRYMYCRGGGGGGAGGGAKIIKISSVPNMCNLYDKEEAEQSAQAKENEMFYNYSAWRMYNRIAESRRKSDTMMPEPKGDQYDFSITAREEADAVYAKHINAINDDDDADDEKFGANTAAIQEQRMSDSSSSLFQMLGRSFSAIGNGDSQDLFAIDF
mmetsp:Transcript_1142/g.2376  ORF Transcript_1142/g.2376 Transcript_1142/m.2376 type:complete len:271 (-) Transcript_1142:111-923(-)